MANYTVEIDYYQNDRIARHFAGLKSARRYAKMLIYDGIGSKNVRVLNKKGHRLKIPLTPITAYEKEVARQVSFWFW